MCGPYRPELANKIPVKKVEFDRAAPAIRTWNDRGVQLPITVLDAILEPDFLDNLITAGLRLHGRMNIYLFFFVFFVFVTCVVSMQIVICPGGAPNSSVRGRRINRLLKNEIPAQRNGRPPTPHPSFGIIDVIPPDDQNSLIKLGRFSTFGEDSSGGGGGGFNFHRAI